MTATRTVVGDRPGWVAVYTPWTAEVSWVPARPVRRTKSEAEYDVRRTRRFVASLTALSDPPRVELFRVKG